MKQNVAEILKYTAILAAGFVAVRIAMLAAESMKAGAGFVASTVDAAKRVVTEDLNPASANNLLYQRYGSVYGTDSIGGSVYELANGDPNATWNANFAASQAMRAQEQFRRSELISY